MEKPVAKEIQEHWLCGAVNKLVEQGICYEQTLINLVTFYEGCQPWNWSTAVTFEYLPWYILKYTCLERKWVPKSIFDIKFHQKCWFFEKIIKNHFLAQKFSDTLTKIILSQKCPNYWKIMWRLMSRNIFLLLFLLFSPNHFFLIEFLTKKCQKMISLKKKSHFNSPNYIGKVCLCHKKETLFHSPLCRRKISQTCYFKNIGLKE